MIKIHLGCANKYRNGFINCDIDDSCGKIDKAFDLDVYPYPFKTNSVDLVYHEHTMEHVKEPEKFLAEIHRILKPGGKHIFHIPYRDMYGSIHLYNFTMAYFEAFMREPLSIFNKPMNRSTNWHYATHYSSVRAYFDTNSIYESLVLGDLLKHIINFNLFTKRFYDKILWKYLTLSLLKVYMTK